MECARVQRQRGSDTAVNSILFYSPLLYYTLLYYILFYSPLFCFTRFYSIQPYPVLFSPILFYSTLFYSTLLHHCRAASTQLVPARHQEDDVRGAAVSAHAAHPSLALAPRIE